jgi:hypothetical protein
MLTQIQISRLGPRAAPHRSLMVTCRAAPLTLSEHHRRDRRLVSASRIRVSLTNPFHCYREVGIR